MIALRKAESEESRGLWDFDCSVWRGRGALLRLCNKNWVVSADSVDTLQSRIDFAGDRYDAWCRDDARIDPSCGVVGS